ncbi:MAG: MBL fold metallo-hydrolase, partial [Planctomycetota bacterium]
MSSEPTRAAASRRRFLKTISAGALGVGLGWKSPASAADGAEARLTRLSEHVSVYCGPINVGIVQNDSKALLIDCGDAGVLHALDELGVTAVDQVIFTHHHRDQACGAHLLVEAGARLAVPVAERDHFDDVAAYWANPKSRWHLYSQHPHHLMLAEPVPVDAALADGQRLAWGPAEIRVISTPGHTDGSVSYLVEVDGKRIVFSGDCIYDEGQLWELYSLQKGFQRGKRRIGDYHGFLGAQWELIESLGRIRAARPEVLVPSHGRVMRDPPGAIDALLGRLEVCYDRYVAASALRHYFPELFTEFAGRPTHMAIRPGKPVPDCLRHVGTTWVLVSEQKAAFVMDCGSSRVVPQIKKWIDQGEIESVEGLWVTHYHDDHVNAIPDFQKEFDCPCITDRHVAEVITNPLAWRLPCISESVARVDRPTADGESWPWREFRMTAYHLPGQTLYH